MGQFGALYKKNFTYWRRGGCGCFCEVFLPILLTVALLMLSRASDTTTKPKTSYLSEAIPLTPYSSFPSLQFPENHKEHVKELNISEIEVMK